MFHTKANHLCAVMEKTSGSFLPKLPTNAPLWREALRSIRKCILAAEFNPQSRKFFMSLSVIAAERKKQGVTGSWVIHPFSIFRLYYEMWMTFVFLGALIYRPLDVAFRYYLDNVLWIPNALSAFCLCDIAINFYTGYCLPNKEIEMNPTRVAKNYFCSIYFITDLLSSLPIFQYEASTYNTVVNYLALLKIFRLLTFMIYLHRTLHVTTTKYLFYPLQFFKCRCLSPKICILTIIIVNYISCCNFFLTPMVVGTPSKDWELMGSLYILSVFYSASFILGVEVPIKLDQNWSVYGFAILIYIIGGVFIAYLTEVNSDSNSTETKYCAIMSQMNAFMQVYKFPPALQNRVYQYYEYKYQKKFFNERTIDRYISDKLRKEIKFQTCYLLVQSVSLFESLPSEILEVIVTHLKKEIYLPQDLIIKSGVIGDCMYFLSSGTVSVSSPSGKEVCHLRDGDYFGEIGLIFPNQKTTASIKALECCELYKLERRQFKKCFEARDELFKTIKRVAKRRIMLTQDIEKRLLEREHSMSVIL